MHSRVVTCSNLFDGGDTTKQIFIVALRNSSRLFASTPGMANDAMAAAAVAVTVAAADDVAPSVFGDAGGVGVCGDGSSMCWCWCC